MPRRSTKKVFPAVRKFAARRDAAVGSIAYRIERAFGLPQGSVRLQLPSGRRARSDKSIGALLDDWSE
jgi:hypothetical protein